MAESKGKSCQLFTPSLLTNAEFCVQMLTAKALLEQPKLMERLITMRSFRNSFVAALAILTVTNGVMAGKPARTNDIQLPKPPADKAQVVWYRTGGADLISCAVKENGQKISSLGPNRYFIMLAEPGRHEYVVSSEASDKLVLDLKAGESQFASCHIGMGIFVGRPKIDVSSEYKFRAAYKLKMVDGEDMGPGLGAMRPEQVAEALKNEAALQATPQ